MSFNILLDKLPNEYEGWLIRTDYRIGIQISNCMDDRELNESQKLSIAASLLFGNGVPDAETAIAGIGWFLRCGEDIRTDIPKDNSEQSIFFDFDAGRIWSSFRASFGIDLHTANLHWFEFCYLLSSLGKDTALSNAMEVRTKSLKGTKGEERASIVRAKMSLTPPKQKTEAERAEEDALKYDMDNLMRTVTGNA